ncbi:peptide MFS transporter [Sphingosinicella microcystinivorans]|uniref:peptide MFS transporter n=1 Tax=Sphingosinicella microcystinivorans TaxID=335406 RepID=UPI0022F3F17F|nr:peptide MFS transporter [Sphingosinicella microcystinivorans]WBX82436.1 peptide MFS transporter [Sphingosinicella microcystinivorans]
MTISEDAEPEAIHMTEDRRFLGHPVGLGYLAFTEAWERFSFYGMQALLVLYMTKELLLPGHVENVALFKPFSALYGGIEGQALASAIFGTYAASVYLTPILGGFLADRVLGKRRTVLLGAVTMALGHFLMAFEAAFLFALLCLVLGSGMFKGNIASQVGALYGPGDLRRADAFQIFYLGINAGVIASPLVVGTLGETVGWHWGFGAAGVGMLIALAIYLAGQKHLPREHFAPQGKHTAAAPKLEAGDWPAVIALLLLIPVLAVAIVPNNQIFNAYLVWGDQQFDLVFMGEKLPTTWLVTLDAVVSVSFLALVALFYRWYGKRRREPDEITKIIIGSAFSVGGMFCLYMAAETQGAGQKIGLAWPVAFHVINSIGFAHMLPVSLALFAKVAPKAINATVIGLYYLAFFTANALVGWIGGFYETMRTTEFWLLHAGLAAGSGMVFVLFKLFMGRRLAVQG